MLNADNLLRISCACSDLHRMLRTQFSRDDKRDQMLKVAKTRPGAGGRGLDQELESEAEADAKFTLQPKYQTRTSVNK